MGTEITLEVGGLTVDRTKNARGSDHGALFQEKDRKRIRSDQINYNYFADNDEDPGPMEMAFSRRLKEVVPRLELLGFTLKEAESQYVGCAEAWREGSQYIDDEALDLMTFEEFCVFATSHPIQSLDNTFISSVDAGSKERIRGRFTDESVTRRLPYFSPGLDANSERSYFADLVGILHPHSVLRVLAENAANLDADVIWQYGPLVQSGWAREIEFTPRHVRAASGRPSLFALSRLPAAGRFRSGSARLGFQKGALRAAAW